MLKFLAIFILLITASCSTLSSLNPFSSRSKSGHVEPTKPGMPFSLEISDEVNDGERLHILGTVSAATNWDLKDVIVKLSSLSEGEVIGVSYLPLSQKKKELRIKAEEKYSFTISVPSLSITDYQLELLWGDDAKRYITSVAEQGGGSLEVQKIQIETIRQPCDGSDCKLTFRLSAMLHNATNKIINKVILGIGFSRIKPSADLDLTRQIPQNEDKIDVGQIHLLPGGDRSIRINFDQEIPEKDLVNEEGEIKPSIRIVSFSTE